ncbi:MAG TPA: DNA repair protein RecO [Steroidobacteraceae bacterium]|jgi:DNA repair protein RecO (recombination protein O)
MMRNSRRVALSSAYILHHRPFRETGRIFEVLTREDGRLSLFARGVRGPKARLAAVLQPFRLLLLSWSGRGDAPSLTGAESMAECAPLPAPCLLSGFYINELVLRLTTRHDPQPALFDAYHGALESLKAGTPLEPTLRVFEKRLLQMLGYGLELDAEAMSGRPIEPEGYYYFRPGEGLFPADVARPDALAGSSLKSLRNEQLAEARELKDARSLLQAALAHCLDGRELATRSVARSMARRGS